jgi:hypothetical protein
VGGEDKEHARGGVMELIINGVRVENVTYMNIQYRTGDVTPPAPDPTPEPEPEPTPDQPCGQTPSGVTVVGNIDLNNPGSQIKVDLGSETKCWKFRVPTNTLFGNFDFANVAGTLGIQRYGWISNCPGGEDIGDRSTASGTEVTSIRWANHSKRAYAFVEPGKDYYVNIRNGSDRTTQSTCPSGQNCAVYRMIYTS